MAISINFSSKVITIPQADLTFVSAGLYQLDVNAFRLALKDIEDNEEGAVWPDTHRHATQSTLAGVTYARQVEILSPYTVTFQDVGTPYTVKVIGGNHNISDVKNVNQVSLIIGNSAGLISVTSGSGVTAQDKTDIINGVWTKALETMTAEEMMRVMMAALSGKREGMGTALEKYMGRDGVTPRITLVPDAQGNGHPTVNGAP
jgi:hypothetical protein